MISKPAPAPTSPSGVRPPPNATAPGRRLGREDLPQETIALARALIGKLLVRVRGDDVLVGRIVETEAYTPGDPASHAFRGETARNRSMFGPSLHAYVYFIYGSSWCFNITAEDRGVGAAVLVRACEPLRGLETMRALRGRPELRDSELARGPGNVCRAFAIGPHNDGVDLTSDRELWIADDGAAPDVGVSARIGLSKAADAPLRVYARGNPSVSGRRSLSP